MDEQTKISYDKNAGYHAEKFKTVVDSSRPEFQKFINLLPGKKILDIGCGSGDHAEWFVKQGLDVIGIDISEKLLIYAKENGVDARYMDMENMSFEKESFDGVWAVTSLIHVKKENIAKVLSDIHSLLKNDGIFYVSFIGGEGQGHIEDGRLFAFYSYEKLVSLLSVNFEILGFQNAFFRSNSVLAYFCKKK